MRVQFGRPSQAAIPVLKKHYTAHEAAEEKARIEDAYRAGLISYDKKRGMKMVVTKSTEGWSPTKLNWRRRR